MKHTKKIKAFLCALVACYLFTGCKVSRDVALPEAGLPAVYRSGSPDTAGIASMPWQQFFASEELKTLIADALAHNNDLQTALKNIEAAELTLRQARLGNIPAVGISATASTTRPSDNSLNGLSLSQYGFASRHIEDYTLATALSWEADIWGKIKNQKAEALAAYLQTLEARKAVQTTIVSGIAKGYYNLLTLDAQLAIAKRNLSLNDSTLTLIKLQYASGQVTSLAVAQADAQRLVAAGLIPQFEKLITVQENAISILSGRLPTAVSRSLKLETLPVPSQLNAGLPAALLARRPDVRLAELQLSKENASVGYAKANMYPSLTITAQGGLDAFKASNWFNIPASLFGAVAGGITQPLFAQRKLRTQYELAKVSRDQSVIGFRQSVLVAAGEVSDELITLDKLQRQQFLAADRVTALQNATLNASLLFNNGLATYLEVITAQSNMLQSELELAGIKKLRLDATVDLYRAVGGGWQ